MIDINFGKTFDKVQECFEESSIKDQLESITIIRDVEGKIRLFLEPKNSNPELDNLKQSLSQKLGSYYGEDIWLPKGEKDSYKKLIDIIEEERVLAEWDDGSKPRWYVLERHVAKQAWTNQKKEVEPLWSQEEVDEGHKPAIVSFFSFKGGVGRTTTLVATALTLARHGHRVAIVDLDLESPGISTIFFPDTEDSVSGVIDYLLEKNIQGDNWKLRTHLQRVNDPKLLGDRGESLNVLRAGSVDNNYLEKLARLDFQNLLDLNNQLPKTWHDMFRELNAAKKLDFILLDTRTGFHDIGGLAIADLSHVAVIFGTQSRQSWAGLTHVIRRLARPLAPEPLPVLLVHALAPGLGVPGMEQELRDFREEAYIVFQKNYYREEDVPNSNDLEANFYPIIIDWQSDLRKEISLFERDSTPDEERRLSNIINVLTGQPYQELAERLCSIFQRKLKK
ncbi:MAG: CpsD/CapB family tyrosine-protein kinase [Okeania sp. SIO2C9]|uniref:KGGVGR-motif variant AAA ATPase n=1 Tax=Okeania sp. SIO2C9 TaxID=2607791 RepID=UPI0013C1B05C|nr:AAA family ATPase [Okeania sp. SIO2C9]NEQ74038.1 CpsD/CapB family tyrosine-protein kinase [Okeania sp. SIO2C9]